MADQLYLVKIVLITHSKCSLAGIAGIYFNRFKAARRNRTNLGHSHKQMAERKHPFEEISEFFDISPILL